MHNWLIFQYCRARARSKIGDVGLPSGDPIELVADSWRGTQKGR